MPASLPGSSVADNIANPSSGQPVMFDPLSGLRGSPLDARRITGWDSNGMPIYTPDPTNCSTGALNTGIGYGHNFVIDQPVVSGTRVFPPGNHTDDMILGRRLPDGVTGNPALTNIGGGRSFPDGTPKPYNNSALGFSSAGNGRARDTGAGPAFTGTIQNMVTAVATVANGAFVEGATANRSGQTIVAGQSILGMLGNTVAPV